MNGEWLNTLWEAMTYGRTVSPRGQPIRELDHWTIQLDIDRPVLTVAARKLNYRFMHAEALWILRGDDRLATIMPYNRRIAEFSDDGLVLAGAYGPRLVQQLGYVVNKLLADRDTRQATLTLWQPNPPASKDIPCTVAMDFKIRDHRLNAHVFMRSSDIWLGLPYDVFTFSCIAMHIMALVNHAVNYDPELMVSPGTLFLTAASSHLYERNAVRAHQAWQDQSLLDPYDIPPTWWQKPGTLLDGLQAAIQ